MSRPIQSVGHNETKVSVKILNHDSTAFNSISQVKLGGFGQNLSKVHFVLLTARLVHTPMTERNKVF